MAWVPVTAVPWGPRFALFATDSNGAVRTAAGDPQSGLMGAWAPVSDNLVTVPGAPVTAVPWGPRFALFATNSDGAVCTAGGDPQSGLMGAWAPVSDNFVGVPGAPVTAVLWGPRFALFATNSDGVVYTAGGDPQNGLMGAWAPVSDNLVTVPGAPVTAVPWWGRFALFATNSDGAVCTAGGDPQNGLMGAWAPVSDNFVGVPGARVTAVPWWGRFALFATNSDGVVYTAAGDPQGGLLGPWAILSTVTLIQFTGQVTVRIDHPSFDPAKFTPKPAPFTLSIVDESFPETRQIRISAFPDVVLGNADFVGKITALYRGAGAGSFPSDGAMTIPDVVFNIHFEHFGDDSLATFSLSTGTATSPMNKVPPLSGQPADNDGAIVLVGAGAMKGGSLDTKDFSISLNGTISPRPA